MSRLQKDFGLKGNDMKKFPHKAVQALRIAVITTSAVALLLVLAAALIWGPITPKPLIVISITFAAVVLGIGIALCIVSRCPSCGMFIRYYKYDETCFCPRCGRNLDK